MDILEQFEISKMAAKMAAGANRKITFEPVDLESSVIPCLTCYELSVFGVHFVILGQQMVKGVMKTTEIRFKSEINISF